MNPQEVAWVLGKKCGSRGCLAMLGAQRALHRPELPEKTLGQPEPGEEWPGAPERPERSLGQPEGEEGWPEGNEQQQPRRHREKLQQTQGCGRHLHGR